MTPERWDRVKTLFDAALQLEPTERIRWLDQAAADDPTLAADALASHRKAARAARGAVGRGAGGRGAPAGAGHQPQPHRRAGAAHRRLGGRAGQPTPGLETWESLPSSSPERAASQADVAVTHTRIGQILAANGDLAAAVSEFQAALALGRRQLESEPANVSARRAVAGTLMELANTQGALQQHDEALPSLREAHEMVVQIAADEPLNAKSQHDAWVGAVFLGIGLNLHGDLVEAEAMFRRAVAMAEGRVAADPASALAPNDVAVSYANLGDVQAKLGRRREARAPCPAAVGALAERESRP